MQKKWLAGIFIGLGLCFFLISAVSAGGWAVLTLDSWPGTVVAGEPFSVRYALRQHGQTLVAHDVLWMDQTITAVNLESGERVKFAVQPTSDAGYYEVEMILPEAGTWQWTIHSFGQFDMPDLTVLQATAVTVPPSSQVAGMMIPATTNYWIVTALGVLGIVFGFYLWFRKRVRWAPLLGLGGVALCLVGLLLIPTTQVETAVAQAPLPPTAEMGEILFQAKGCTTCHHHEAVTRVQAKRIGPNLTNHKVTAEFLRIWLHDPAQIRPETYMPNLQLADAEIEALIAFLVADESVN